MSKVVVDRLVLETEGAVSHDLAELFRQVADCSSLQLLIVIVLLNLSWICFRNKVTSFWLNS